jgi:hypothetical protein
MRAGEFVTEAQHLPSGFSLYRARVRVKQPLYSNSIEVAVYAKSVGEATALLRAQYGSDAVVTAVSKVES